MTSKGKDMLETRKEQQIALALFRNKWPFFSNRVVMLVLFSGKKLFMPKNKVFSLVCNYAFFIGVQMKSPLIEKEICILLLQPNW